MDNGNVQVLGSRQKFSEADKQRLVAEYLDSGKGCREFAKELGIDNSLLSKWTKAAAGGNYNPRPSNSMPTLIMPFDPFAIQDKELMGMNVCYNALKDLESDAVSRILAWISVRTGVVDSKI